MSEERDSTKPVKVTVSDPETGAVFEETIVANDYVVITAGTRYVGGVNIMGGTHIVYIKREKRGTPAP